MESVSQTEGDPGSQNLLILQASGKCGISRGFHVLQDLEILSIFPPVIEVLNIGLVFS